MDWFCWIGLVALVLVAAYLINKLVRYMEWLHRQAKNVGYWSDKIKTLQTEVTGRGSEWGVMEWLYGHQGAPSRPDERLANRVSKLEQKVFPQPKKARR